MYTVLDIEATGGKKGEEDIIEVAIYQYDGRKIVDQFISLVQPGRDIDFYVQKLTGITTKMVQTAPKFHEVAKRIIEITEGTILVGHNVDFDYRMLKQEFKKLGYAFYRETIDTVTLSERLLPDATSYSLGKLTKELGIPVTDRHRASGDARATLELFKLLLDKDTQKEISKSQPSTLVSRNKFASYYKDLPNTIGVFYFLNEQKEVIYLARSTNIAQSVRKALTSKSAVSNQLRMSFDSVHYEETGNELISWVKEFSETKPLKPFLSSQRMKIRNAFYLEEENGYKILQLKKYKKEGPAPLLKIVNLKLGLKLFALINEEFDLCPKLNGLIPVDQKCLSYEVGECRGACEGQESPEDYNQRVDQFLQKISIENRDFLLIGKGRKLGEKSFILMIDGYCKGFGYFELNHQIKSLERITERMTVVEPMNEISHVIQWFLFSEKYDEIISLHSLEK
ncbi:MAG: exonuclease domain-containing protein [Weeksellaceae bacterium]